jgi:hypothetical protein
MQWYDALARRARNAKPADPAQAFWWLVPISPVICGRLSRLTESFVLEIPHANNPSPPETRLHDNTRVAGNTGPELSSLLADGAGDGRALHLTLGVDDLRGLLASN